MAPRFASPAIRPKRRCSPDADGLGDGSDDHRYRALTVGQAVRSALQSRCHIHVLSIGESRRCGMRCSTAPRNSSGAVAGVALASLVLQGAPAHKAVRYAATVPGIYGDTVAFVAELAISFILMSAILFASNHEVLARLYTLLCRHPGCDIHRLRISPIRYEHESRPDVRPRIVCQLLARPLDLFHCATRGHAGGGRSFSPGS